MTLDLISMPERSCPGCFLIDDAMCPYNWGEYWCPTRLLGIDEQVLETDRAEGRITDSDYRWAKAARSASSARLVEE